MLFTLYLAHKTMDFLDTAKVRRHRTGLKIGYALIGIAIAFASILLLYQTDGYCLNSSGDVGRCGLVFVSSQPKGASMYLDGKLQDPRTNTKLNLESGQYTLKITREGYRPWQRVIESIGGDVRRYDYPFLFPTTLQTDITDTFNGKLAIASQSPDQRWLLTAQENRSGTFTVYDLRDSAVVTSVTSVIPATVFTAGDGVQNWSVSEWSRDNRHVLLLHQYTDKNKAAHEYIMFDRENSKNSQNITNALSLSDVEELSLFDERSDQFYVYNSTDKMLVTRAISGNASALSLENVLSYKTIGDDTVLYITDTTPDGKITAGKVNAVLLQGNRSQVIRQLDAGAKKYLMEMAQYGGSWYIVIGSSSQTGVRVYKNPLDQPLADSSSLPTPLRFLHVENPTHVSFSSNARFVLTENGSKFAVYDAEYDNTYLYTVAQRVESSTGAASWMDGHRLYFVSKGSAIVRDYDNQNVQTLQASSGPFGLFFTSDYSRVFAISTDSNGMQILTTTNLRAK